MSNFVPQDRGFENPLFLDHVTLGPDDLAALRNQRAVILWNVKAESGFLAQLPNLEWLEIRGGSAPNLQIAAGCSHLRFLEVLKVRGMTDLIGLSEFTRLEFLRLYGLARVRQVPSLAHHRRLLRLEVGMMRTLEGISPLLDAPNLEELQLEEWVNVTPVDIDRMRSHPSLRAFNWWALDTPQRIWGPADEAIQLPKPDYLHPHEWFAKRASGQPTYGWTESKSDRELEESKRELYALVDEVYEELNDPRVRRDPTERRDLT